MLSWPADARAIPPRSTHESHAPQCQRALSQRASQAVAAGLEGHSNARDLVSRPHRFIAPAIKQRKEGVLICLQFLEWLDTKEPALSREWHLKRSPSPASTCRKEARRKRHVATSLRRRISDALERTESFRFVLQMTQPKKEVIKMNNVGEKSVLWHVHKCASHPVPTGGNQLKSETFSNLRDSSYTPVLARHGWSTRTRAAASPGSFAANRRNVPCLS